MTPPRDILVIKLSALGDFIQACAAFERVRAAHPGARITLLTTPPYGDLARASPYFNWVETDGRPKTVAGVLALIGRLRRGRFDLVYDLQGNDRTNLLFQTLRPAPPRWSGVAFGCALPHRNAERMTMHTLERQAEQLRDAEIWPDAPTMPGTAPAPNIDWMLAVEPQAPVEALAETRPIALLVPGAAAHRSAKRWPASNYAALARELGRRGFAVQLIGGPSEAGLASDIQAQAPETTSLVGRTDFAGVATLGARAAVAVGNDTGPVHLLAAAGAPTVALFSSDSDPALCAPRGRVAVLREPDLNDLAVETVMAAAITQTQNQR